MVMGRCGIFAGRTLWLLLAAMVLVSWGCAPPKYKDYDAFLKRPRPIVGGKPYVIEPPDQLRLIADVPELSDVGVVVRPDGYITLYLLGDVFAAGKTPTQLASEIQEAVQFYYEDAHVQVEVTGFNSKFYYMAGETGAGPARYTGKDTVLDAVLRAGVPRTAWPEKLVVLRPNEEDQLIRRMTINFRDITEKGDLKYNAVLEEGDIVFMPLNPLAAVGVALQNLLFPVNPLVSTLVAPARVGAAAGGAGVGAGVR